MNEESKQKRLLLLGGSAQQIVAIEKAKELGYYTIVCDYLEDNPGQYHADKFYLASTTDKEKILEIAKKENIDGIIAYASDPAAPTAAYISEKLNLPGNPYESVEILCNKDRFRKFLSENGFNTPKSYIIENFENFDINNIDINLPVIVKPVDSSGSKGVERVYEKENLIKSIKKAFEFSRSNKVIVEKLIEKNHKYLIGGDILVYKGEIILFGLLNCHIDSKVNDLVPVGKSFPLQLENKQLKVAKDELNKLVKKLNLYNCAMNVEIVVDSEYSPWFIDVGPRSGGNLIPELLGEIFKKDIVEIVIKLAMGEDIDINFDDMDTENKYFASHNIHSSKSGYLKDIIYQKAIEDKIFFKNIYKTKGDYIEYFDNSAKALGVIFMHFDNLDDEKEILNNINDLIEIKIEND